MEPDHQPSPVRLFRLLATRFFQTPSFPSRLDKVDPMCYIDPMMRIKERSWERVGKRVIALRLKSGLSKAEAARRCGVTWQHMNLVESGFGAPSFGLTLKLASVLCCDPMLIFKKFKRVPFGLGEALSGSGHFGASVLCAAAVGIHTGAITPADLAAFCESRGIRSRRRRRRPIAGARRPPTAAGKGCPPSPYCRAIPTPTNGLHGPGIDIPSI